MDDVRKPPEIIAIASGKGGTGKTLLAACFGYALTRAGHRVLLVDGDPGTDGLSLFLLGPKGMNWISSWGADSTFRGALGLFKETGETRVAPRRIERSGRDDHGCTYTALISGKGLYGDEPVDANVPVVPDLDQATFRRAITTLLTHLRSSGEYDYVIVDTRGGFAFESTDICAAADSFLLVTDADYTSFHQNRNLIGRISAAASAMGTKTLLRAILVNRAVDGEEQSYRRELSKEFPVQYSDTFAIPLDVEAIKAYRLQQMPYVNAPASGFAQATLSAFADILQIVTAQWARERVEAWNALVQEVSDAIERRNLEAEIAERTARRSQNRYRTLLIAAVTALLFALATTALQAAWPREPRESRPIATVDSPTTEPTSPVLPMPTAAPPGIESAAPQGAITAPSLVPVAMPVPTVTPVRTAPTARKTPLAVSSAATPLSTAEPEVDLLSLLTPRGAYTVLDGKKTSSGLQMFRYRVWLDVSPSLLPKVSSVRYHFNHPTFQMNDFVGKGPTFEVSYDGWGCVRSVTATVVLTSGPPRTFDFSQCAAISVGE